ncbi:hypothetical protein B566_EDAN005182 [Ephemera danica]|nr:hypothetical protein B566_EDAN005182 [Ephemera danica]
MRLEQAGDEESQDIITQLSASKNKSLKFMLKDGILHASTPRGIRLFLPKRLRPLFLHHTHDTATAGHLGISKTLHRLKSIVYWPKMTENITHYVNSCERCLSTKPVYMKPAGLIVQQKPTRCWEHIAIDFVGPLVRSKRGNKVILVITDLFSKWVQFIPLRETTAEATALALRDHIFTRYGVPKFLTSDNAPTMTSHAIGKLLEEWGVQHIFITPYHSQANSTERVNRNLKAMLQAYCSKNQKCWDENLPSLRFAINTAVHETTGLTPAELHLGKKLVTPLENNFFFKEGIHKEYTQFQKELVLHLEEMKKFIQPRVEQAKARQARNYNKGRREVSYLPGQLVLIREHPLSNAAKNFSAKLADRWSSPYKVIRSFNGVDLEVENEGGVRKTVHVCNVKPYTTRRQDLRMEGGAAAHGVTEVSQES